MWLMFVAWLLGVIEQKAGVWMVPVLIVFVGAIIAREDVDGT
jgi:hypothetical protein